MMKQHKNNTSSVANRALWIVILCFGGLFSGGASAITITPIDLNDFFADPTVTVAGDGSSALIAEDSFFSPVLLSNDPGLGDPEVIFAAAGRLLKFDFSFTEAAGENDEFGAFVLDASGVSAGPAFEFFADGSSSGVISFDLSSLVGELFLGLQFQLSALPGDTDFGSTVTVSNVRLEDRMVPEPSSLALFALGMLSLVLRQRRTTRILGI